MNAPLLELRGLTLKAAGRTLLRDCTCGIARGELVGVIGPNGAGKSSLLKALAGLLPASKGVILLDGAPLSTFSAAERARRLAYLEQQPEACWPLAVHEIVALGLLDHGFGAQETARRIDAALQESGCAALRERRFHQLSTGERMQVHLARVLVSDTPLILADEPIAALDLWHQHHLLHTLHTRAAAGKTVIVALHDLALAARYCSRLLLFDRGELVREGPAEIVLHPDLLERCYRVRARFDPYSGALLYEANL
ncbi:MAG: ATP-binding cassette domain-containing protein [Pseudomonadales bacterium]|jgi:iron complex transport system ATP-binding protein|nr:ATP-binding cassette domain-containing protein [Pseudomonadales bacterium]